MLKAAAQEGPVTQQIYTPSTMLVQMYFDTPYLTVSSRAAPTALSVHTRCPI